jgi:hypothetical protein
VSSVTRAKEGRHVRVCHAVPRRHGGRRAPGTAAIAVTIRLVQRHSFGVFAAYRVAAALAILSLLIAGVR